MAVAAGTPEGPAASAPPPLRMSRAAAYLLTALGTVAASWLRLLLDGYIGPEYLLFHPVVVLATLRGGLGPGIFAALSSAALSALWILPLERQGGPMTARQAIGLALFTLVATFLALVAARYRSSLHRIRDLELVRARREADARFGDLADAAPVLIWISGPDGRFTWFNRAWLEFTGRAMAQEVGSGWTEGLHPDDLRAAREAYLGHLARRAPFVLECRLRRHDGEYRWIAATGVPRKDERGAFAGYLGTGVDLTEHKRSEEALRINQARLDLAMGSAQLGLWELDLGTGAVWRTLQHDRIFGYDELQPAWSVGEALRHVVPEDRDVFHRAFEEAFATGRFHYELRIQPAGHPQRWIAADGELFRDAAGAPARMRGVVVDVTERRAMDERAARAERLAAVATLVRGMSHEINSPLASVVANLDYLREQLGAGSTWLAEVRSGGGRPPLAELQDALADAAAGADRVKLIVKDMTTFLPRDRPVERHACPGPALRAALELAAEELRPCAGVAVEVGALPDVPVSREDLVQVLYSLLANAGQATGSAPNQVRVAGALGPPGRVTFTISDTGTGMTPFVLQHVFEPFFTTRGVGRGKGLGLPLCRGVIDSAGGEISIESAPGLGTTVTVTLPVFMGREA